MFPWIKKENIWACTVLQSYELKILPSFKSDHSSEYCLLCLLLALQNLITLYLCNPSTSDIRIVNTGKGKGGGVGVCARVHQSTLENQLLKSKHPIWKKKKLGMVWFVHRLHEQYSKLMVTGSRWLKLPDINVCLRSLSRFWCYAGCRPT